MTLLACLTLVTVGCAANTKSDEENEVDTSSRPSMEQVIEDYQEMRTEMFAELGAKLGEKPWGDAPNDIGQLRSGCGNDEDDEGERVGLSTQSFQGTYDRSEWQQAAQIVWRVGREYGFTETGTIVDRADDLKVYGEDEYGGRYILGMAVNTTLGISTGCHRWDTPPSPAPAPSGPPSYAE